MEKLGHYSIGSQFVEYSSPPKVFTVIDAWYVPSINSYAYTIRYSNGDYKHGYTFTEFSTIALA